MKPMTYIIIRNDGLVLPTFFQIKSEAKKALKFLSNDKKYSYSIQKLT